MAAILTESRLNLNELTVLICISLMCTRVSSEWIKELNVRPGIVKSLDEKPGRTDSRSRPRQGLSEKDSITQKAMPAVDKWDFRKWKTPGQQRKQSGLENGEKIAHYTHLTED